jgi:hypothetical protein
MVSRIGGTTDETGGVPVGLTTSGPWFDIAVRPFLDLSRAKIRNIYDAGEKFRCSSRSRTRGRHLVVFIQEERERGQRSAKAKHPENVLEGVEEHQIRVVIN